jgi:hypothetical protein
MLVANFLLNLQNVLYWYLDYQNMHFLMCMKIHWYSIVIILHVHTPLVYIGWTSSHWHFEPEISVTVIVCSAPNTFIAVLYVQHMTYYLLWRWIKQNWISSFDISLVVCLSWIWVNVLSDNTTQTLSRSGSVTTYRSKTMFVLCYNIWLLFCLEISMACKHKLCFTCQCT